MYTTGEVAKMCGVSVRTVQYYDSRSILSPSGVTEGGRRLYAEQDVKRMRVILFLRDAGLSIGSISHILGDESPGSVINVLLDRREEQLLEEMEEKREMLRKIEGIRREMKSIENFTVESIGDIALRIENKKSINRLHAAMLIAALPVMLLELAAVILWITRKMIWPAAVWLAADIVFGVWMSMYYYRRVQYICPQCHRVFRPSFQDMLWARHTASLRKLTCAACGWRGFCVEIYGKEDKHGGD